MKSLSECIADALDNLRKSIGEAPGSEAEVLSAFEDEIGAELEGWKMRLQELEEDGEV